MSKQKNGIIPVGKKFKARVYHNKQQHYVGLYDTIALAEKAQDEYRLDKGIPPAANQIDYSLKNGEKVWFTYKTEPESDEDWHEAEIMDLNWAYIAAAIQIKGYKGPSCHGIRSLSRNRYYKK